jgi:regulator of sigma E protease
MLSTVFLIIAALLSLTLLIVVHEFGHFLAAKLVKIWPEEFGIGLPPKVWGKKWKGTYWTINAIPLGGFVRLHGEVADPKMSRPDESYVNKSKLARAFVALAGIFMNFVYAILAFTVINAVLFSGGIPSGAVVTEVKPETPASTAGFMPGDEIVKIGSMEVGNTDRLPILIGSNAGKTTEFMVVRDGNNLTVTAELPKQAPEGQGLLGIVFKSKESKKVETWQAPFVFLQMGVSETWTYTRLTIDAFGNLFRSLFALQVPQGLVSPLGVVGVTAEAAKQGWVTLLAISAIISVNLAIFNLLPFPPLDGSRVLFLFIEAIIGKKRLEVFEEKSHTIGMALLLALAAVLLLREVPLLFTSGSLSGFVQNIVKLQ